MPPTVYYSPACLAKWLLVPRKRGGGKRRAPSLACFSRCLSDVPHQGKGERQSAVLLLLLSLNCPSLSFSFSVATREPNIYTRVHTLTRMHRLHRLLLCATAPQVKGFTNYGVKVATIHFPLMHRNSFFIFRGYLGTAKFQSCACCLARRRGLSSREGEDAIAVWSSFGRGGGEMDGEMRRERRKGKRGDVGRLFLLSRANEGWRKEVAPGCKKV